MIAVNTPVVIDGKDCILMRDLLGSAPNEKYTNQEQGDLKVWYEEDALQETREAHPELPVFGFWQTLIASGLIDTKQTLQYVFTNDSRDFGYYFYSDHDILHTGSLFQDELQRLPGPAITDGITIEQGHEIKFSLSDLRLPSSPLRTHRERIKAAAESKKKTQQRSFLSMAIIVAIGLIADTGLEYHHDAYMDAYREANAELHMAEQTLVAINKQKLTKWPDQTSSLANLYQLSTVLASSKMSGEISLLSQEKGVIEVTDIPSPESKLTLLSSEGFAFSRSSANKTLIEWDNNDAD